jgi:CheY-like chemotaxis protein
MKKLLMADDESGVRSLVRMTFESGAYEILEASDGNQARNGWPYCRTLGRSGSSPEMSGPF